MRRINIKLSSYRQWRKACVSTWPSSHLSLLNQYINSMIVCLSIIAILCSVIVALSVVNYRLRSQVSFSKEIVYHNSLMTRNPKLSKSAAYLQHHKERATSEELRQFRYIYWIDHKWKKKVLLKQKPYPKHYVEKPNNFEKVEAGGLFFNSFETELSNEAGT
jgi:hypothetical protein